MAKKTQTTSNGTAGGQKATRERSKRTHLTGQRFGRLVVLGLDLEKSQIRKHTYWRVLCDCGATKTVYNHALVSGATQSCGCLHRDGMSLPPGIADRNRRLRSYKGAAARIGIFWDLSDLTFADLTSKPCHYCGGLPSNTEETDKAARNGLDRVDSHRGYTLNNVVPCCWVCNWMKRNLTQKTFLLHITKIYTHQFNKAVATHA